MPATVLEKTASAGDALREVSKLRSILKGAAEDVVRSANRAIKRSRYVAEDLLDDTRHRVKQRPMECVGVAFGVGVLAGTLIAWLNPHRS